MEIRTLTKENVSLGDVYITIENYGRGHTAMIPTIVTSVDNSGFVYENKQRSIKGAYLFVAFDLSTGMLIKRDGRTLEDTLAHLCGDESFSKSAEELIKGYKK